jgi:hypothetical protein
VWMMEDMSRAGVDDGGLNRYVGVDDGGHEQVC